MRSVQKLCVEIRLKAMHTIIFRRCTCFYCKFFRKKKKKKSGVRKLTWEVEIENKFV